MAITATAIGTTIGLIIAACVPVLLNYFGAKAEKKKADDLIVKTNPPDPDGIADIDAIQRVQDDRNLPPVK